MKYNLTTRVRYSVILLLAALCLTISNEALAQKTPENEAQLKKEAAKYFENEDYVNAYPLYSQLLSLYPQDPNYNYRFGACMLYSQADKQKPLDYLEHSVLGSGVDLEAFYYIGVAYHLNYRFDDAIREFNYFKIRASSSQLKQHPVDRLIEMCNNAKSLLRNLHDLDVLRKKELRLSDYYEAYDLSSNGGNLLVEPDDFKTKIDKKKNLNSIIYLSPDKTLLFFASYGDDDKNGKDIYLAKRLNTGGWGKPQNLGSVINTQYDEDYPFYDAPTHTLYFCSKGHNSMGGYDVFKSNYNDEANTWSQPVNMDFPINTPGDDILFVADTLNQTAFFSSTRSSPDGEIAVYKILIQPHPPDSVLLNGIAYGDDKKTPVTSRITVKNGTNNEVIGIFSSSNDNGGYTMNLVNGGSFVFMVETPNHKTQSEAIALPTENELAPLRQQISYEPSTDKLIITNNFGNAAGDSSYLAAMDYIQKKALMNVNVDTTAPIKHVVPLVATTNTNQQNNNQTQQNSTNANNVSNNNIAVNNNANNTTQSQQNSNSSTTNSFNNQQNTSTNNNTVAVNNTQNNSNTANPDTASSDTNESAIVDTSGKSNVSNQQLETIAYKDAKQQQQQAQSMKDESNKAVEYANSKMQEAQQLAKQAQETTDHANSVTDPKQKQDSLDKAASLTQQSQQVSKKAIEAFQLASQTQSQAAAKQQEADQATQYSAELDSALKAPNHDKAIAKLQRQRDSLEKQAENNPPAVASAGDMIRNQARDTKQDSVETAKHNEQLKKETDRLQQESEDYVAQAQKTDNAQEKVALLNQAKDLDDSKKNKEKEIKDNEVIQQQLHDQYTSLLVQAKQADSLTKNTSMNTQVATSDRDSLQHAIQNYTPTNNTVATNNIATNTQSQENNTAANNTQNAANNNVTANNTAANNTQSQENNNITTANNSQNTSNNTVAVNNNTTATNNTQSNFNNTVAANNTANNNTVTPVDTTHGANNSQSTSNNNIAANNNSSNTTQSQVNNNTAVNNTQNASNNTVAANNNTTNNTITPVDTTHAANTQSTSNNNIAANNAAANNTQSTANNNVAANNTQNNSNNTVVANNTIASNTQSQENNNTTTNNTQNTSNNNVATNNTVTPVDTTHTANVQQNNNTFTNNNTPPAITYSNNTASQANKAANTYTTEATNLSAQADEARTQARQASDPAQAKALYHKADSLDNAANERKATADVYENDANKNQFATNQQQLSVWQNAMQNNTSDKATTAQLLTNDANLYYKQYIAESQKADSSSNPYIKQTHLDNAKLALETSVAKQQKAHDIYLQLNPQLANVTVPVNNPVAANNNTANNTQNTSNNNTAANNTQNTANNNIAVNNATNNTAANNNTTNNTQVQENNNTATNNTQNNANNNITANNTNNTQTTTNNSVAANNNTTANNTQSQENNSTTNNTQNTSNSNLAANTTNNTQSQENNNTSANNTQNTTNNNTVATNNSTNTQTQSSNNNAQNTPNDTVAANNTTHPRTISSVQYNSNIQSTNSANNTVATTTNNNVPNNTTISITEDIFQESSSSPYSEQHPIPVNPPLPEGLVYKIQVGAFRNPIPQDLFKGIQPIMAETTAQGFKRYTVGLFKEFNGAQGALAKVKGLGYKDAFIVAFYNGKRVPINSVGAQQIASNNSTEPNNNAVNTNNTTANNITPVNNNSQTQANNTAVAPSTSVTDVKGLFYTVQVGAVKDPVPASKLYNLSPLFSYRAANGYLRYNCGIYSTIPKANAAKDAIVAKTPIKDAFVVAYLNGERVGLTQASQSVTNGSATISKDNNLDASPNGANTNTTVPVNNTPSNNTPVNNTLVNNTPANNTQTNTTPVNNLPPANTAIDTSKVVFSVQVGAYSGEIPLDVANNILKIASQGIHTHKGDDGIVIYTVGSYPDYTNASLFKDELVQDGFPGCFVVAYYHGKKISLQEAQSLMNK